MRTYLLIISEYFTIVPLFMTHRRILNEDELVSIAQGYGVELELLKFEELSFAEQINKFVVDSTVIEEYLGRGSQVLNVVVVIQGAER